MNETLRLAIRLLRETGFVILRVDGEEITVRPMPTREVTPFSPTEPDKQM